MTPSQTIDTISSTRAAEWRASPREGPDPASDMEPTIKTEPALSFSELDWLARIRLASQQVRLGQHRSTEELEREMGI